jgi:hypothetical protein
MEAAPKPDSAPEATAAKTELLAAESPPLLPAGESPVTSPSEESLAPAETPAVESTVAPTIEPASKTDSATAPRIPTQWPCIRLRPRHKRYAILATSLTLVAAIGATFGALASVGFSRQPTDSALIEENKAMQQSIARLGQEITTLKANLEQANRSAHSEFAKISERLSRATAEITNSISAPQTAAPQAATRTPLPRQAPERVAAAELPPIVPGWTIWRIRNGYVYVAGRGEVFEASIGAVLPGLGPVQSVRRQEGHWMVQTSKGIIVSTRDTIRER